MVQRITYTRRHPWRTKSNRATAVKTPGGRLVAHYLPKKPNNPKCGDKGCQIQLNGIPALRPKEYRNVPQRQRTVSRAYGGNLCGQCVRQRIVRAFLIEEQKIVKSVLRHRELEQKAKAAAAKKTEKKGGKGAKKGGKKQNKFG
eukprot:GABV01004177.1.p2 GENE.GABV01004177.1~~GABV01004177.1.p2  ORF type:complete len:144 (+),score=51.57 GABV01004177.1:8-439(+)